MLFDPATVEAIRDLAPVWLALLLAVLSFLGSAAYQVPMLVLCYVLEARDRTATWLAIVAGGYSFRSLLKSLNDVDRPPVDPPLEPTALPALVRPVYEHPAEISTTSFPSGHVIAATVLWGLLVVDTDVGTRRQRLGVAATVVTVVAASRVVLGAHYLEDVVAGLLFGGAFLAVALFVRARHTRPVGATMTLAAGVSVAVLSFSHSTTASVVLGVSVGVLAVIYGPELVALPGRPGGRYAAGGGLLTVVVGAGLASTHVVVPLAVAGAVAGGVGFWLPRRPLVRSVIPDVVPDSRPTRR